MEWVSLGPGCACSRRLLGNAGVDKRKCTSLTSHSVQLLEDHSDAKSLTRASVHVHEAGSCYHLYIAVVKTDDRRMTPVLVVGSAESFVSQEE